MDSVLSLLGLAQKAGKIASGEFATEKSIKSGRAYLVIVSGDASENIKKKMRQMTEYYEVPLCIYGQKEALGRCVGKSERSMLAILDQGFSKAVEKRLKTIDQSGGK